jgi:hypothetical protein
MKTLHRVVGIGLLVALTLGVCVQYGATDNRSYPSTIDIIEEPGTYDGETVLLFGEVETVGETVVISIGPDSREVPIIVADVPPAVMSQIESGGSIQVYGTLHDNSNSITAENVVVDFASSSDFLYVYVTSLVGLLFAVLSFLWYWRIDFRRLRFVSRGES